MALSGIVSRHANQRVLVGALEIGGVEILAFDGTGDYDDATGKGTDNAGPLTRAFAASSYLYLPPGKYLFSTFAVLQLVLRNTVIGPGRLFYDNGSTKEEIGGRLRIGVNDPNGNLGTRTQGGVVLGGAGPGFDGQVLASNGPAWGHIQPSKEGSSSEWQVYNTGFAGRAVTVDGTGFIDATGGYTFPVANANRLQGIEAGDIIGFSGVAYLIETVVSATRLKLQTTGGGAVTFSGAVAGTFYHSYYYADGLCNTSGTAVTWLSGDYFFSIAVAYSQKWVKIGGVRYTLNAFTDAKTISLTGSAGTQSGAVFQQKMLSKAMNTSLFRVQGLGGGDEEALALFQTILGRFKLAAHYAGNGEYRSISIGTGDDGEGDVREHIVFHPDGTIELKGLPTSASGLSAGKLWTDNGTVKVA